jgi:F-type H+-transporting ATPase subunit beta
MDNKGKIIKISGQVVSVVFLGNIPEVSDTLVLDGNEDGKMEVVSVKENEATCVFFGETAGLKRGQGVICTGGPFKVKVSDQNFGRVVNFAGKQKDGMEDISERNSLNLPIRMPPLPFSQKKGNTGQMLETGIKAVDFFSPLTVGGKIGMFGGAGVGKTVLLTELINNLVVRSQKKGNTKCVFCAVGERLREARDLCQNLKNAGVYQNVAVFLGQMGENPAIRFVTPLAALSFVEYLRDEKKKDVLFFMDNVYRFAQAGQEISGILGNFPSEDGYQPSITSDMALFHERLVSSATNNVTSIEAVFVPSDDNSDHGVREIFPYLDAFIILSRDEYQKGRMPAVDLLKCSSSAIREGVVTRHHINALTEAKAILKKAESLERVVSLIGPSELSLEDQKIYKRAEHIKNYMTQPLFTVENQTGRKGEYVNIADTVEDVMGIIEGKWDSDNSEKFLYLGRIVN